jgi:hypothetical protein
MWERKCVKVKLGREVYMLAHREMPGGSAQQPE